MQLPMYKPCNWCRRTLPLASFGPNPKLRFGTNNVCRECINARNRKLKRARSERLAPLRERERAKRMEETWRHAAAKAEAIPEAFGHWLAGFADGEACFDLSKRPDYNGQGRYTPRFVIVLRADDRAILDRIQRTTGLGTTREKKPQRRASERSRLQYGWFVSRKADVVALVALFDRFPLQSKKARDFAIWREAALLYGLTPYRYRRGRRGREAHGCWDQLGELTAELMATRRFA